MSHFQKRPKQSSFAVSAHVIRKTKSKPSAPSWLIPTFDTGGHGYRMAGDDEHNYLFWREKHRRHARKNREGTYWLSRIYKFRRDQLVSYHQHARHFHVVFK